MQKTALAFMVAATLALCCGAAVAPTGAVAASISSKSVCMSVGQSSTLSVKGVSTKAKWSSSKKSVATVNSKGKVTGKKAGTATVTAKVKSKSYSCAVTVAKKSSKTLIAYFSCTGTTEKAASKVAKATGADVVRIQPAKAYSSADLNYNENCRANAEQDAGTCVAISTKICNIGQYKTVIVGHPIWWGKEPGVIRTFLKKYSAGKVIVPFCTSGGSGFNGAKAGYAKYASKAKAVKEGKDLTNASLSSVKSWLSSQGVEIAAQDDAVPSVGSEDGQVDTGSVVVERAFSCLGKPYLWGACSPDCFDDSGLVSYCLTGNYARIGTCYTFLGWPRVSDPEPGDVVVSENHCGIYIGGGQMIHSSPVHNIVEVSPVESEMIFVRY